MKHFVRLVLLAFSAVLIVTGCRNGPSFQVNGGTLVGAWRSKIVFRSGMLAEMKDLEFLYSYNAGGTMTESSNYDEAANSSPPAYGVWKQTDARQFTTKYVFYTTKAPDAGTGAPTGSDWWPAGHGVLTETITLSDDGQTYASTIKLTLFDNNGTPITGAGEGTGGGHANRVLSGRNEPMVRQTLLTLACVLGLSGLAGGVASESKKVVVWQPPPGLEQIPIWPNGAPDMADVSQPAERMEVTKGRDVVAGRPYIAVYDVTSPTMTVFPPKGRKYRCVDGGLSRRRLPALGDGPRRNRDLRLDDGQRHDLHLAQVSRSQKQPLLGQGTAIATSHRSSARPPRRAKDDPARSGQGEGVEPRSQQDRRDRVLGRRLRGRADQQHLRADVQGGR
jgi:hypothetical protein